jgi:SprB repeat
MSIIIINNFFINKKYHMKKIFTLLIALCSFLSWSFGQVYTNDFSGGSVSTNEYVGTPTSTPGPLSDFVFDTKWTATTGATMALSGGALRLSPLPGSGNATLNLNIKVRCGYRLDVTGISFKHGRNTDGPQEVELKVDATSIATINPVPLSPPTAASFSPTGFPQSTFGEMNITLDLKSITAAASGIYEIDDFEVQGTYTYVGPTITPVFDRKCELTPVTLAPTIPSVSPTLTSPTYQWYKGATNVIANMTLLSGEVGSTYADASVVEADQGFYAIFVNYAQCVGDHTNTAISSVNGLDVNSIDPGSITPATVVRCQGDLPSPILTIGSQLGDGTLSYAWKRSNTFTTAQVSPTVAGSDPELTASNSVNPGVRFRYFKALVSSTIPAGPLTYPALTCTEETNVASVQTNARPVPTITTNTPTCAGSDFGLTYNNGVVSPATFASATWSVSNGNVTVNSTNGVVTAVTAGTSVVTYTVTDSEGCSSSTTAIVTVNALPTLKFTATITGKTPQMADNISGPVTLNLVVCPGDLLDFSGFMSSGNTGFEEAITSSPNATYLGGAVPTGTPQPASALAGYFATSGFGPYDISSGLSGTITQVFTPYNDVNTNGVYDAGIDCQGATITLVYNISKPNVTFTGTLAQQCVTATTYALTGGMPTGGTYSGTGVTGSNFDASVAGPGTHTITYTYIDANGCTNTATNTIKVNALPSAGASITNAAGISPGLCEGMQTVTLSASPSVPAGILPLVHQWTSGPSGVLSLAPSGNTATGTSGMIADPTPFSDATVTYSVIDPNTGCASSPITTTVRVFNSPSVAVAGSDQAKCNDGNFTLGATAPSVGTGVWTVTSGSATITTSTSATSTITGVPVGTSATLTWTVTNGPCAATSSSVVLTNYAPVTSVAGSNQALCNTSTFTMAATAPSVGTGVWSVTSGTATITTSTSAASTVTGVPVGTSATLTWTVTNGTGPNACTSASSVTVTNNQPPSTATILNAPSIEACNVSLFTVNAQAPAFGTGVWTVSAGGTVVSSTSATTIITVPQPTVNNSDTYTATWSVSAAGCPTSTASVNLINYHTPTMADAGVDQAQCDISSFTLAGNSPAFGTGQWTQVSVTNGTVATLPSNINNAGVILTRNMGVANSTATLRWTISNGVCPSTSDDVVLSNDAPVTSSITATPLAQCDDNTFNITGSTPQYGSGEWSVTGGSANPTNTPVTEITVTGAFVSGLATATPTWTVTNGTCSSSSSVTLTNHESVTSSITGTIVQCNDNTFDLTGNTPSVGAGVWTVSGGSASPTNTPVSTITTSGVTATATWTVTNGTCSSSSTVTLTNHTLPTTAVAGMDQIKCADGNFTLAGNAPSVGTGMWSIIGAANGAIITDPTDPATTVTGINANSTTVTLRWTISNGTCTASTDDVVLKNNPAITVSLAASPKPKMCVGSSIQLTPTISGGQGTGFYTTQAYSSTGLHTSLSQTFDVPTLKQLANLTGLSVGSDNVVFTVTDNAGCSASASFSAIVVPALVPNFTGDLAICGASPSPETTTVLTQSTTGGSGTYTHAWVSATPSVVSLSAVSGASVTGTGTNTTTGTLSSVITYTVTDTETGCTATTTKTVVVNYAPNYTYDPMAMGNQNVSCKGGSDGAIHLTYGFGINPHTFAWERTAGTLPLGPVMGSDDELENIPAGTYSVTITDNVTGCVKVITGIVVSEPALALTASISSQTATSCNGGSNGSVTLSATGGTSSYSVTAVSGPSAGSISGMTVSSLSAGNYTFTVTDAKGCTATTTATVTQPAAIVVTATPTAALCFGGNGSAALSATGGNSTYTFTSSGGTVIGTTLTAAAGTYTVTATDGNGCTGTEIVEIEAPDPVTASVSAQTNVSCTGGSNGSVTISASGGTGTITITSVSPNAGTISGFTVSGLTFGNYTFTVTDANGCTATTTATITQPMTLLAGLSAVGTTNGFNIACNGASTGVAQATALQGTAPYTYAFSAGTPDPLDLSKVTGLMAGSVTVTITDANSCTATAVVVLTQPAAAVSIPTPFYNNSPFCVAGQGTSNNGGFQVGATGGVGPFTYTLSPMVGTQPSPGQFANLTAQTYTVITTDASGCTATSSVTVAAPPTVVVALPTATPATICSGASTALAASATGGTIVSYSWSVTASTGATATPVPSSAGTASFTTTITQVVNAIGQSTKTFTVTAGNTNGCSATNSVVVTVNPLPFLTGVITPDPTCPDAGGFGIAFTANNNAANQISVNAGSPLLSGFTPVVNQPFTSSPIGITIPTATTNTYGFTYTVRNTTTGCVSPVANVSVLINPRPNVFSLTVPGTNEICPTGPKQLRIQSTGTAAGLPRTVQIQRDSAGVLTTFNVITTSNDYTTSYTLGELKAGIYSVLGVVDVNSCSGTVSSGTTTLLDARIAVTKRIADTTVTVPVGCIPTLVADAQFNSALSVGTLSRQWQVDRGTGYVDSIGATSSTLVLANPIAASNNGWKYRLKATTTGTSCNDIKYSGEFTITVGALTAAAGPDQTLPSPTFTMAATATGGTGVWTVVSGTAAIASSTVANSIVTVPVRGSVTLRWTVSSVGCSASDEVVLTRQTSQVFLTAFLQGPLLPANPPAIPNPLMSDALRVGGYIPLSSPYPGCPGTITPSVLAVTGSDAIVDWVKVVLHGPFPSRTARVDSVAALIQRDGDIVSLDGSSAVNFNIGGNYYLSVDHRNHLAVMTDRSLNLALSSTAGFEQFDFTDALDPQNATFGTPQNPLFSYRAMWSGDINGNGEIRYNNAGNDRALILTKLGGLINLSLPGYNNEDANMDGFVKYNGAGNDRSIILINLNGSINSVKVQGF